MKKVVLFALVATLAVACNTKKKAKEESQDENTKKVETVAANYVGMYEGTLPCASCEGILTNLTLNADKSFSISEVYKAEKAEKFENSGNYELANDSTLALNVDGKTYQYRVKSNMIVMLGQDGKEVTGDLAKDYILYKK